MKHAAAPAKNHITITICIVGMILLSSCGKAQVEQIAFGNAQVIRLECESQSGSGVIYASSEGNVVVVTAAHVLEGAEKATIIWESIDMDDNEPRDNSEIHCIETDTITKVSGLDLAFLKIENATVQQTIVQSQQKSNGDQVFLRGYDASGRMQEMTGTVSESWIYVEDFGYHMMIVKAATVPGMSGGGVF